MLSMRDSVIAGGDFRQQITHVHTAKEPIERLHSQVSHAAFHNSAQRTNAPRCHPNTRVAVKQDAHRWVMRADNTTADAPVMWLSGGAGAGKSAIAQSLADEWSEQGVLLASFFFSRSDSTRNHVGTLVATLIAQIYNLMPPQIQVLILRAIEEDPLVWSRDIFTQLQKLVARPLHGLIQSAAGFFQNINNPRVLIIDGLDECLDRTMHGKVLQLIGKALTEWHLPFLFLVASRPEPDIVCGFESWVDAPAYFRINLGNDYVARADTEHFLRDKLAECKKTHPFRQYIPPNWPPDRAINTLVDKSSGHFIYASVAVRYVTSTRHHPHRRLDILLKLRPAESAADTPFAELDALYSQILASVQDYPLVRRVFGLYTLTNISTVHHIEQLLSLEDGDVQMAFSDITSLVSLHNQELGSPLRIQVLHASFPDYLLDLSRSGEYHFSPSQSNRDTIIALLSCLSRSPFNDEGRTIRLACTCLEDFFCKVEIDFAMSEFMCSTFSLSMVHSTITQYLSSIKPQSTGRVILYSRVLSAISSILAILDISIFPFALKIRQKLRADFDTVVSKLLEQLPQDNRLKFNIASVSGHNIVLDSYYGKVSCLDFYFLNMITPFKVPDFPDIYPTTFADLRSFCNELRLFFTTAERSGKYAVCPDTFSGAAIFCMECLQRHKDIQLANITASQTPKQRRGALDIVATRHKRAVDLLIQLLPSAGYSTGLIEACLNATFSPISLELWGLDERAWNAMSEYLERCGCILDR